MIRNNSWMRWGLVMLLALPVLTGCQLQSALGGNGEAFEIVQSQQARNLDPDVSDSQLDELVSGNTGFALELYQLISEEAGNQFYSPLSISLALAMTYGGARGETASEMADALNFTLPDEQLHPAFNALDLELANRGAGQAEGFELKIANSTWGQLNHEFLESYLDLMAVNYGAAIRLLDFINAPDPSREVINNWVSDQTNGRIENLLPPGSVDSLTRLVLTNAIYFNADWQMPFPKEATSDGTFTRLDGSEIQVPMMRQALNIPYAEINGTVAIELPYKGEETSMVILMPERENFSAFQDSLTPERLDQLISGMSQSGLRLTMPKFNFSADYDLVPMMQALGMSRAFDDGEADFSGIDGTMQLIIKAIFHKAFVAVDEEGTEAAAATGVVVGPTSAPADEVLIDRPFLFLIRDRVTGSLIFVGRVVDPSGE